MVGDVGDVDLRLMFDNSGDLKDDVESRSSDYMV